MSKKLSVFLAALTVFVTPVFAGSVEDFYKGKTMRLIVGGPPGGGFDTYARIIARHMGKHIPGNPGFIVQNMPGAGGLIAANHTYTLGKPDGLTIAHLLGGVFLQQLVGLPEVRFDAGNFGYVGVPVRTHPVIVLSKASGITNAEQLMASKTPVTLGGVGPGAVTDNIPKVLTATLDLPIQLVSGYPGTAPIRAAFHRGEVDGVAITWESVKATWREELDSGQIVVVLQAATKAHAELPGVAVAIDLAKTEDAGKLLGAVLEAHGPMFRPFVAPPGVPEDRLQILRRAFMETMRDAAFLAEAKKARLDIEPVAGEELQQIVREVFKLEPALVEKLKDILG